MSDGARLLYTGSLVVRPVATCAAGAAAEPLAGELLHRFHLATSAGRAQQRLVGPSPVST